MSLPLLPKYKMHSSRRFGTAKIKQSTVVFYAGVYVWAQRNMSCKRVSATKHLHGNDLFGMRRACMNMHEQILRGIMQNGAEKKNAIHIWRML